jgi:hypothetical protein
MGSAKLYVVYLLLSTMVIGSLKSVQYVSRRVYNAAAEMMGIPVETHYKIEEIRFDRTNWDETSIWLVVVDKATGEPVEHLPVPSFEVITQDKKTIMEGIGYDVPIPDNQLGPQQPYTIRVSTVIQGERIVATEHFTASPKTVVSDLELIYPLNKNLLSGEYAFNYKFFRQSFDDAQYYEPISVTNTNLELVINRGTARELKVNISKGKGNFNLGDYANYNAYKQYVLTNIAEGTQATVNFTPVVNWNNTQDACDGKAITISMDGVEQHENIAQKITPAKALIITENHPADKPAVATNQSPAIKQPLPTPPIKPETAAGSANEINAYAQKAAHKIMRKYDADVAAGCRATIKIWKYDSFMGQYTATISTTWYNKYLPEETYRVEGTLTVTKDGNTSQFTRTAVNQTIADIEKYNGAKLKPSEQLASLN